MVGRDGLGGQVGLGGQGDQGGTGLTVSSKTRTTTIHEFPVNRLYECKLVKT